MLSTDKQTDKLTNATKNITSLAKEVITCAHVDNDSNSPTVVNYESQKKKQKIHQLTYEYQVHMISI